MQVPQWSASCGSSDVKLEVDQQCPQDGEAAEPAVDQHRVLADPAEPGQPREVAFEQRGGVGHGPAADAGALGLEPVEQRLEPSPEDSW